MALTTLEPLPGIWRAEEVAKYLAKTEGAVYALVSRREIPCFKIGRSVRFRQVDIDAWIALHARHGSTASGEALWTLKRLAKYLRTSESAAYAVVQRHRVPHVRLGTTYRFRKSDIDQWMQARSSFKPAASATPKLVDAGGASE